MPQPPQTTAQQNLAAIANQRVPLEQERSADTTTASSRDSFTQNFDAFLKLLTTQLKYQDPTSPVDSHEFTNQLVLFSGVEQQIKSNEYLQQLQQSITGNSKQAAANLLGKEVEVEGNQFSLNKAGNQYGLHFALAKTAKIAVVEIHNAAGQLVASHQVDGKSGSQYFTWDGLDRTGKPAPAGKYSYQVLAYDKEGKDAERVDVTTYSTIRVAGIGYDKNDIILVGEDGNSFPFATVQAIRAARSNKQEQNIEEILSVLTANQRNALLQYIGKLIEVESNRLYTSFSNNQQASLRYEVDGKGSNGVIKIYDDDNKLVRTVRNIDATSGSHVFTWDGKDDAGNQLPDGDYRYFIEIVDANNNPVPNFIYTFQRIIGLSESDGKPALLTSLGQTYQLKDIVKVQT